VAGLRTKTSARPRERSASAGLTPMAVPVSGSQMRGGRKGGLPVCECNGLLAKDKGTLPSNNGKKVNDDVPVKPKQFIGHVAMDEQQSGTVCSLGAFLWGQQSMSSIAEDMWSIPVAMPVVSVDLTAITAPPFIGSTATDRTSKRIKTVRPRCMSRLLFDQNSSFPGSMVK
jgi:hypothetical protein